MVKLEFNTVDEFDATFKNKTKAMTDSIRNGIEEAMQSNARSADLFEIHFKEAEFMYEISLPQSQWVTALEACLDHYHKLNLADDQIDTWKLLEAAKAW